MDDRIEIITRLASESFDLFESEKNLLNSLIAGKKANYSVKNEVLNTPKTAAKWGSDRLIRASFLIWLCTDTDAIQYIPYQGLRIIGARFEGSLNLQFSKIDFPLIFHRCYFNETIWLKGATIRLLDLSGTHIVNASLEAESIRVENDVLLCNGFCISGRVSLAGATIGGVLQCSTSRFNHPCGDSLIAQNAEIKGDIFLNSGFYASGQVWLRGAMLGGSLVCSGGRFESPNGYCLMANSVTAKDNVYLDNGFYSNGQVSLSDIKIGGSLKCEKASFINSCDKNIIAERAEVEGDFLLRESFLCGGSIWLLGATIGGNLDCSGSKLCSKYNIQGLSGDALIAQRAEIRGTVFLRDGFHAKGLVLLSDIEVGGDLDCDKGIFENCSGHALLAESAKIGGAALLRKNFKSSGIVSFYNATVEGGLYLDKDISLYDSKPTTLDLRFAKVRTLSDTVESWPQQGCLRLYGFIYERIDHNSPSSSGERLKWLRLQNLKESFSPQPYEQLAQVLKGSGYLQESIEILIAKQEDIREYGQIGKRGQFWNRCLGITIKHGYQPLRALWISVVIISSGIALFHLGYKYGLIEPSELEAYSIANPETMSSPADSLSEEDGQVRQSLAYPEFFAPTYSLDVFLPVIDLHQSSYWMPKASRGCKILKIDFLLLDVRCGGLLLVYFWIHILLGWVFTSLWVAGFSGLIRRVE
ncbi:hypothetical protein IQ254_04465 [Nodosilinea sp. LEGE 07088]|uniref:hypothetical protein n=1 Tax=Nodosilinea sp. LEGE 07088 TaxID=2777968 RepID=UPI00187DF890|nr:hypothetical protein [Nodosilinea sp. LEGE 07088]MBE9136459.1 hypothetical protein [Nodosilinea sp. LEGE 07088]